MARRSLSRIQWVLFFLEFLVVRVGACAMRLVPRAWIGFCARAWVRAFANRSPARQYAFDNLDRIFREAPLSDDEKQRIYEAAFTQVCRFNLEFPKMRQLSQDRLDRYVCNESMDVVRAMQRDLKGGLIVVSLHIGNWDMMAKWSAYHFRTITAALEEQPNPFTSRWIFRERLQGALSPSIATKISQMRQMLKLLRQEGTLALLADATYYLNPMFVPFFGEPVAVASGPARIHLQTGAPIVFSYTLFHAQEGKYHVYVEPPRQFDRTGDTEQDMRRIMEAVYAWYEDVIRKHPDQWHTLLTPRFEQNQPQDFDVRHLDFDPW